MSASSVQLSSWSGAYVESIEVESSSVVLPKNTFEELIARLPHPVKADLFKTLECLPNQPQLIAQVCDLAISHEYSKYYDLFMDKNFEYYVLAAVKEGLLTSDQFGSLMFVRAIFDVRNPPKEIIVIPLFEDEAISPVAWDMIMQTFTTRYERDPTVTPDQLAAFFDRARKLPSSEQYFVFYDDKLSVRKVHGKRDLFPQLVFAVKFNIFGMTKFDKKSVRMVPSFGMMQALLDVTSNGTLKIIPRIGEITPESTHQTMKEQQGVEIAVHCPQLAPLPKVVGKNSAIPVSHMLYHYYFAWTAGLIPPGDRRFYQDIADVVLKWPSRYYESLYDQIPVFPESKERSLEHVSRKIYSVITRMEFSDYRLTSNSLEWRRSVTVLKILDALSGIIFNVPTAVYDYNLSKKAYDDLKDTIYGVFGVWMLHKENYDDFSEVTALFDKMKPEAKEELRVKIKKIIYE